MKKVFNTSSRSIIIDSRRMLVIQPGGFIELRDEEAEEAVLKFPLVLSLTENREPVKEEIPAIEEDGSFTGSLFSVNDSTKGNLKTAHTSASKMLRDERIKARVDSEIDKIIGASREEMRYKLINRLSVTGFSDIAKFLDDENNVLPKSQWPEGASVAIKDVVNVPTQHGVRTEIKLKDDKHSQELMVRLLSLVAEMPVKVDLTLHQVSMSDLESGLKLGEE